VVVSVLLLHHSDRSRCKLPFDCMSPLQKNMGAMRDLRKTLNISDEAHKVSGGSRQLVICLPRGAALCTLGVHAESFPNPNPQTKPPAKRHSTPAPRNLDHANSA